MNTASENVTLTVNSQPTATGARNVVVKPLATEYPLRQLDMITTNRHKVDQATGGRVGYIYLPDMEGDGLNEFVKQFFPQIRKEGLIIDVRYNGGGFVDQLIFERLRRILAGMDSARNFASATIPDVVFNGPLACVTNAYAASDGDIFSYYFKKYHLGPLIGTRTWGGVRGIRGYIPLLDGGYVTRPEFSVYGLDSQWVVENHGVEPDIEVDNRPDLVMKGQDPQLERAIEEVMKAIKEHPKAFAPAAGRPSRLPQGSRLERKLRTCRAPCSRSQGISSHRTPSVRAMSKTSSSAFAGPASASGYLSISNSRRWLLVGLLFVASFINYLDRATISVALPLISVDLRLGPEIKGLVLSSFFWSYALMQIPVGWCVDRWNLRWVYAVLFAIWSLACGLTGFAGSLAVLILVRMVLGIGESIYLPGGTKIVSMLFPSAERAFPSGFFDSGTRLGLAVGAPLIAALIMFCGWRKMFALVGFTAIVWLVPWLLAAPKHFQVARPPVKDAPTPRVGRIRFNKNLLGICLGFFCFDYYWYLLVTWLPDYLVTVRHLTLVRAGFYAGLPYLAFGICQALGGWLTDRLIRRGWDETRTRKTVLTFAFLSGLLLIPAARAETSQTALLYLVGSSLVGLSVGNMFAIIQCCAPPQELGIWTGFENFAGNIGGVLAPIATGYLIARTGAYLPGFALAAGVLVIGLLAYWFIVGDLNSAPSSGASPDNA